MLPPAAEPPIRSTFARRTTIAVLTFATTAAAGAVFGYVLWSGGFSIFTVPLLLLFLLLFVWVAMSFWVATLGAIDMSRAVARQEHWARRLYVTLQQEQAHAAAEALAGGVTYASDAVASAAGNEKREAAVEPSRRLEAAEVSGRDNAAALAEHAAESPRRSGESPPPPVSLKPPAGGPPVRTALIMPIYNEDPKRVFSGLRAMWESVIDAVQAARIREAEERTSREALGEPDPVTAKAAKAEQAPDVPPVWETRPDAFDLFILSDTTNPDVWLEEELAWAQLRREAPNGRDVGLGEIYYRRRPRNVGRKAGNIEDFCERWGPDYRYMIVLDADSVMAGETLLALVERMEDDLDCALMQAPPVPVNKTSLFARMQQFAASVYGPIFTVGLAAWAGEDGNYWGHNAIIRVDPFTDHCGLPKLPGIEPLGGEILSHDFVEAALLRRAGWRVRLAPDLGGSYEETPANLLDFAARDRRWCQGNLQHLKLLLALGWHPVSRLHLTMGVMSYVAAPLWLLFMLLGVLELIRRRWLVEAVPIDPLTGGVGQPYLREDPRIISLAIGLFVLTMAMLLLPKLWSYFLLFRQTRRLKLQGGRFRAGVSVLIETVLSVLVSPVMMAFHTVFVVTNLMGRKVGWNAQSRGEGGQPLATLLRAHWMQMTAGVLIAVGSWYLAPWLFWWLTPVFVGLILSAPLSLLLGSPRIGRWLRDRGLLLIPEEVDRPEVLRKQAAYLQAAQAAADPAPAARPKVTDPAQPQFGNEETAPAAPDRFLQVILDPAFNAMHIALLRAYGDAYPSAPQLAVVQQLALKRGPKALTPQEKAALLSDEAALRWLHRAAWKMWPMDVLQGTPPPRQLQD